MRILNLCAIAYQNCLHPFAGNKLEINVWEYEMQRLYVAPPVLYFNMQLGEIVCFWVQQRWKEWMQGEQSSYKGERNTMCACVSLCVHWRMVVRVLFHSFLPWCTALLFCTKGTSHAEWVLFDIDSSLRERVHSKTGAGKFILGKKQIVVYFPGSGCRTCEEPTALMLQRWHSTR